MRAGIALGSNVGDRLQNLRAGRAAVMALAGVAKPLLCSHVYETEPVGPGSGGEAFLNAVIEVEYDGLPAALLAGLLSIEVAMGRPPQRPRNAPRTLDLDILYAGDLVMADDDIVIPHPRLHERRFVLQPLHDICPELRIPRQQSTVRELLGALRDPAAVAEFAAEW